MKKSIISLAVIAAMMFSLTACGKSGDESSASSANVGQTYEMTTQEAWHETEENRRHIDLEAVYNAIIAEQPSGAEPLVMFPESKDSEIVKSMYPDLERFDYNQMVLYVPPVVGYPCEIMLAEAKYRIDADHAEEVFQERIERAASDTDYPENSEGWVTRAEVQRDGFYVAMIVLPEGYTIPRNVFDLVGE
ncbi:MAG: DUF4358 domain-containing protein [Oscillospiraceae bacterium]